MFTLNQLTLLALAGTSIAAPALMEREAWRGPKGAWAHPGPDDSGEVISTVWDIATAYVTVTGNAPTETAVAAATTVYTTTQTTPTAEPTVYTTVQASSSAEWAYSTAWTWTVTESPSTSSSAETSTTETPSSTSSTTITASSSTSTTSTSSAASATSTSGTWLDIANEWRSAGGLAEFSESSTLVANALKTAQNSGGKLIHELNPGTLAQVLAPGNADNFYSVYVGGWLCEIPTLTGLDGICTTEDSGWDHSSGETGHAEILTSTAYTQIGCALAEGIWACDLC